MKTIQTIIIAVVLTAVSVGGGVYYYQNHKIERELAGQKDQIANLQSQVDRLVKQGRTTNQTTAKTSDWKIYSNPSLKYSIRYPSDWILNTQYINDGTLFLLTKQRKADIIAGKAVRVFDISVKVYNSSAELPNNESKNLSFKEWIEQEADSFGFGQRQPVVVDGVSGYQGVGSGENKSYMIFVQKDDFIYQIETGDTTQPTETEQEIINSFKFL